MVPDAPPAAGIQDTDWRSGDIVRVPSFFLYAADPLGGAIVIELDSVHCPGPHRAIHPSGEKFPVEAQGGVEEGQKPSRRDVRF
jgi:hypothetical protein